MYKVNPKNRTMFITMVVIAILLISAGIYALEKHENDKKTAGDDSQNTINNNYTLGQDDGVNETPAEVPPPGPTPPGSNTAKLSYIEALKIYGPAGNNNRFQFSANCLATPARLALKKSAKFMIDNRDTAAHTFAIGKQSYKVSKYGFVIVTATETGTIPVKCDGNARADIVVSAK